MPQTRDHDVLRGRVWNAGSGSGPWADRLMLLESLKRRTPRHVLTRSWIMLIGQLKQLAELRDQGILTDEEFNAQKARILA